MKISWKQIFSNKNHAPWLIRITICPGTRFVRKIEFSLIFHIFVFKTCANSKLKKPCFLFLQCMIILKDTLKIQWKYTFSINNHTPWLILVTLCRATWFERKIEFSVFFDIFLIQNMRHLKTKKTQFFCLASDQYSETYNEHTVKTHIF